MDEITLGRGIVDLDFVLTMAKAALKAICWTTGFFLADFILLVIYYRCM